MIGPFLSDHVSACSRWLFLNRLLWFLVYGDARVDKGSGFYSQYYTLLVGVAVLERRGRHLRSCADSAELYSGRRLPIALAFDLCQAT